MMKFAKKILHKPIVLTTALLLLQACSVTHKPEADPEFASVRPTSAKPLPIETGTIYRSGYDVALFEDTKARQVGDILTVILSESTNASKKASTTTAKDSEVSVLPPTLLGAGITRHGVDILSTDMEAERAFTGSGDSSQSNRLDGTISVTVSEVLPNGNLVVRGEKLLTLNQGSEHIRVAGIVRPQDIAPNNTVKSSKLANARIIYGGEGSIAESNTKGWLQRLTDGNWWPF